MVYNRTHPLLQQVPLTVSPFVNLPTATTLPYTYRPMPSTLPPSSLGTTSSSASTTTTTTAPGATDPASTSAAKPRYVVSASGHAAHPDDILTSCRELHAHVAKLQADAEAELARVEERIRARELAEKRRLAPGWLDSDARLLQPERKATGGSSSGLMVDEVAKDVGDNGGYERGGAGGGGGLASTAGGGYYGHGPGGASEMAVPDEGEELDRFFGGLALKPGS